MLVLRRLLLGSCLVVTALALAPRPAAACGMLYVPTLRMSPQRADELLVQIEEKLDQQKLAAAARLALQIADSRGPTGPQRAQALAVLGVVRWQQGSKALALAAFRQARRLDLQGTSIEGVLARAKAPAALRAALAG
jgi:cytochrome c-type biogenesis protein CcmH/NrfG